MATDTHNSHTGYHLRLSEETLPWAVTLLTVLGIFLLGYILAMMSSRSDYKGAEFYDLAGNTNTVASDTMRQ
jgi:hypothetical protein